MNIVVFLGEVSQAESALPVLNEEEAAGFEVFTRTCVPCHGEYGEGRVGPNLLDSSWVYGGSEKNIFKSISHGSKKGMPSWDSRLGKREIAQITWYLAKMRNAEIPPGLEPQGEEWSGPEDKIEFHQESEEIRLGSVDVKSSNESAGVVPALPTLMELRIHVITTSNVYEDLRFDIFEVATGEVVGRGQGANEHLGESVATFELAAGTYKIVKAGEPFETRVDFATLSFSKETDFLIVLDADSGAFRGSGVLVGELPVGTALGGVRFALNLGGTLWMNQKQNVVGGTNGVSALVGVFGNFGMVFDRGPHFLTVDAKAQLNLQNQPTSSMFASTDFLEVSALYAFNINNDFVGPYARAGLKTRLFPGYLYLSAQDVEEGTVTVNEIGSAQSTVYRFGGEAHPDDLRIEVAKSFAPLILQEELGANLKAVNVDLKLLELSVATRFGWAFRQGFTGGLLVVEGEERGQKVVLNEVDDYTTTGPLLGASANLTFARWLFGQAEIAALLPVANRTRAGSSAAGRILWDASGTAGLKFPALTSLLHASFDYTFRLQRDGYLTDALMFDHMVMARMSLQLF